MKVRAQRCTHLGLKKIAINPDTFTRSFSRQQSGHDRAMRIEPRSNVRRCYAHFRWRTVGFSCAVTYVGRCLSTQKTHLHVHQASFSFNDDVVTCSFPVWSSLSVPFPATQDNDALTKIACLPEIDAYIKREFILCDSPSNRARRMLTFQAQNSRQAHQLCRQVCGRSQVRRHV